MLTRIATLIIKNIAHKYIKLQMQPGATIYINGCAVKKNKGCIQVSPDSDRYMMWYWIGARTIPIQPFQTVSEAFTILVSTAETPQYQLCNIKSVTCSEQPSTELSSHPLYIVLI